ncbi:MAG TPA: polysaccharide pyruvyl transferase family protein [Sphingomonadaceae bacterium]|nr:polysaccharide pyruvyl transferase family protein [Sphingomonadaceae bacterium]
MASPLRIGVLTFHRCINYGSYWQARCLVEGLRKAGADAVLLDHDSPGVNRTEWRCALQPLLPVRTRKADYPLYASKTRRFLRALKALPRSAPFRLEAPASAHDYDLVIVGSDEVWNLRHPWYGGQALFYGAGLDARRLVSYAASFGNHDAADGLEPRWVEALRGFAALSVRDENSRALIRSVLGQEPTLVLDPCLQFPPAVPPQEGADESPYVAVYGHSFPSWFKEAVRRWAASERLRLVSIGYRNDWADEQRIAAGPEEFARLMAGARAVATNFFHGCVFALLNGKPFACVASAYRSNKLRDLTGALGASRHLVEEEAGAPAYARLLGEPLDPGIFRRIAALRRQSDAYLATALG